MSRNAKVKLEPVEPASAHLRPANGKKYSIMPPPHLLRKRTRAKKPAPEKAILDQACEVLQKISTENDADQSIDEAIIKNEKIARKEVSARAMLTQVSEILHTTANPKDPYHSFGAHIANELRKYDQKTLSRVKYDINRIIHDADMGKYDGNEVS